MNANYNKISECPHCGAPIFSKVSSYWSRWTKGESQPPNIHYSCACTTTAVSEEPPTHVSRQTVGHHQVGGEEAIDRLVNSFVEDTIGEKLDRIEARLDAIHEYFQKKEKFLFEKLKKL